jgi:hypothetical protein
MNKSDIMKDPWLRAWLLVAVVACLAYCFRNVASAIVFSVGFCLIGHSLLAIKYGNTIAGPFSGGYEIKRTNTPRTFRAFFVLFFIVGLAMVLCGGVGLWHIFRE